MSNFHYRLMDCSMHRALIDDSQSISILHGMARFIKTLLGGQRFARPLIVIQYCIFYLIIPMHFYNKYMIFTHLLYIFAGSHSNGEIIQ